MSPKVLENFMTLEIY